MNNHFASTYSLKADNTYTVNGTTYTTDSQGRISEFHGNLSNVSAARAPNHQANLEGKQSGEHAGHLIAASQGGSGKVDNMVRMDAKVNTRDYRGFERSNDKLLDNNKDVHLDGYLANPKGEGNRPDAIMVTRTATDPNTGKSEVDHFSWTNYDMTEFDNDFSWVDIAQGYDNPGAIAVDENGNILSENASEETQDYFNEEIEGNSKEAGADEGESQESQAAEMSEQSGEVCID